MSGESAGPSEAEMRVLDAMADLLATRVAKKLAPFLENHALGPSPSVSEGKPGPADLDDTLTIDQVAERLQVCRKTVERLVMRGHLHSLPGIRRRLFSRREMQRYLDNPVDDGYRPPKRIRQ